MTVFPYAHDIGVHSYLQIEAFANRSGIPHTVMSDFRPGSITITGNVSYHSRGNAVDFGSSRANMIAFADWLYGYSPYTLELIHAGGPGFYVHNGVRDYKYPVAVVNEHYNHVHWAITLSGLTAASGGTPLPGSPPQSMPVAAGAVPSVQGKGCFVPAGTMLAIGGVGIWEMAHLASALVSG